MRPCTAMMALAIALGTLATGALEPETTRTTVFSSGVRDYEEIRIPALVTTQAGTLLAFAEGRRQPSDHGQNDIILRRSTDRGATWGEMIDVHLDETKVFVNPCAVVLDTGRVLLMYQEFPVGYHARPIGNRVKLLDAGITGEHISRTLLRWSDDDGATWSDAKDVTAGTKRPAPVRSTASGPGTGIQLTRGAHKGRVLIPTNEGVWKDKKRFFNVYACYSDDGGMTWNMGEVAPVGAAGHGNEVQMVELPDGGVLLNSRSSDGNRRLVARSGDGGETWSELREDEALIEPRCMGTVLRYSWPADGRSRILFANPATENSRSNGTVRVSYDEGKTWPVARTVWKRGYAYSCLTKLNDGTAGLLYETDGYDTIDFARFSIDWLEAESIEQGAKE